MLTRESLWSLLRGLLIALIGAALTYLTTWVAGTDFGPFTNLIVVGWSLAVNLIRQAIKDSLGLDPLNPLAPPETPTNPPREGEEFFR